ncbi:MAG TPA: IscS subfamily cysteine desulfurase [Planctomycetota bacterium]|nr:IscS subfamily cysteine desulfurase [Planctomycetota bacterium]
MPKGVIYLDNNATTPCDPRVVEAMTPYFGELFGNAASRNHAFGWEAEDAVEKARATIASAIRCTPKEIVFTSGATESNNLALKGAAEFYAERGDHFVTTSIEHKCVLDSMKWLERRGRRVTVVPVGKDGRVDPEAIRAAIGDKTVLVSVMAANNEIGTLQPIAEIGKICKERGVLLHVDAAQMLGKRPIDVDALGVDLLSASGHKIYGPKGVGFLYVRKANPRVRLTAQMDGGGHERGLRSGTLNVPGIVGMGKALELCLASMDEERARLKALRDRLLAKVREGLDYVFVNGDLENRLEGNLNLSFAYVEGESLLMAMKEVAVSSGSACTSATLEPSYVLKALGVGDDLAHTSIRFGIGRFNTEEEIDRTAALLVERVRRLREMSPLYELVREGVDLKTVQWNAH